MKFAFSLSSLFVALLIVASANGAQYDYTISMIDSGLTTTNEARYACYFENRWSEARHLVDYPDGASWLEPLLATHNRRYNLWRPDTVASPGMKEYVTNGNSLVFQVEFLSAGDNVEDMEVGKFMPVSGMGEQQSLGSIRARAESPYMSAIATINPSPDWFTGFTRFDLRDGGSGYWIRSFTIDTYPWTAGTMAGDTYTEGTPLDPNVIKTQFNASAVPETGVFLDPSETTVLPVARWSCTLSNAAPFVDTNKENPEDGGIVDVGTIAPTEGSTLGSTLGGTTIAPSSEATSVATLEFP